jgi:hypothetical protein
VGHDQLVQLGWDDRVAAEGERPAGGGARSSSATRRSSSSRARSDLREGGVGEVGEDPPRAKPERLGEHRGRGWWSPASSTRVALTG